MRFMILVKATQDSEAGMLLDASGLKPSSRRWRIRYDGKKRTVVDAPCTETMELVAGYTVIRAKSRQEAIEWTQRFPNPSIDGGKAEIEVCEFFELEDFAQSKEIERFKKMDTERKAAKK